MQRLIYIHYTLKSEADEILYSNFHREPDYYFEGIGQVIPGIEKAVLGCQAGDRLELTLPPADAHGVYEKGDIVTVFSKIVGQTYQLGQYYGFWDVWTQRYGKLLEMTDTQLTLDLNHPWAGQTLKVELEVKEAREATEMEIHLMKIIGRQGRQPLLTIFKSNFGF